MIPLSPTSELNGGQTRSLGCNSCFLLHQCGGVFKGWDCMTECCGKPDTCMVTCFNSKNFVQLVHDVGGLEINNRRWSIGQKRVKLPTYIPHIGNGYGRSENLRTHTVALTTYDVMRIGNDERPSTPEALREKYRVLPDSRVVLLSVEKDNRLERYWKHELSDRLPQKLFDLGILYVTSPNYSFPINVPRPDNLANRKRSLLSAERMTLAGLQVIPHLNALTQADWNCWRDFLKCHPHLFYVALEFQTGLRKVHKARWHLAQLLNLQESLGRELHLLAIGGKQHARFLSQFSGVTIVDSNPFVKTHKRRRIQRVNNRWEVAESAPDESLHELFQHNFDVYKRSVLTTLAEYRKQKLNLLGQPSNAESEQAETVNPVSPVDPQMRLPLVPYPDGRERRL